MLLVSNATALRETGPAYRPGMDSKRTVTNEDSTDADERLFSPKELSLYLGVTTGALAQMRHMGNGPEYIKISSRSIRYRRSVVEAWLEARTAVRTDDESVIELHG